MGGVMKRIVAAALLAASVGLLLPAGEAQAQSAAAEARIGEEPRRCASASSSVAG